MTTFLSFLFAEAAPFWGRLNFALLKLKKKNRAPLIHQYYIGRKDTIH